MDSFVKAVTVEVAVLRRWRGDQGRVLVLGNGSDLAVIAAKDLEPEVDQ